MVTGLLYCHKCLLLGIFLLILPFVPGSNCHLLFYAYISPEPGRVAQSVGQLTPKSWVRNPVWQQTFVSPSAFSRRAVVSYWRKYVHEVLVNRLGGLSLPRKSVVRLTDRPDMTLDVYRGRKTTIQQQQQYLT